MYVHDPELVELGVDQPDKFETLHIKKSAIQAYWVDPENRDVTIYINGHSFVTPYDPVLIIELDNITADYETKTNYQRFNYSEK